jgi:hypothetical protein
MKMKSNDKIWEQLTGDVSIFRRRVVFVLLFLASHCLSAASREPLAAVLQSTFTNPAPADFDGFGAAFAFVRNDRVVIGAPGVSANGGRGAAYLFNLDGTLLTNVAPYGAFHFGWSLASLPLATLPGYDAVYLGAEYGYSSWQNNGVLYSFGVSTNGESSVPQFWSPEFWNPSYSFDPSDKFSASVATLGGERLIIGAPESGRSQFHPLGGAVFLFDIYHAHGAPLTIITNPFPNPSSIGFPSTSVLFGWSVAAIGNEGILIGAPGSGDGNGSAYLYTTNGLLLTTFTNSAVSQFGYSVAALGPDRVIIGAPSDDFGPGDPRGLAFLFSTNGTLLTTFSNPVPTNSTARFFGGSVADVGSDRVLIGALQGRTNTGAAFLFSTNGTLLATFINPTGAANDAFGTTVASVGSGRVLIGDTAAPSGGAAYLFSLVPVVEMERTSTNTLAISWSALAPGYTLQQVTNGISGTHWSTVTETVQNDGTNNYIIASPLSGERYYRLVKP